MTVFADDFSKQATADRVSAFLFELDDLMVKYAVCLVQYDRNLTIERVDSKGSIDHAFKAIVEDVYDDYGDLLDPKLVRLAEQDGI